ncbi:hypothetical protein AJ87_28820 [Rhizobium yanglingense]|nr:hypothetical protein AJ87_28820 [Rhizobium yanglingense]
MHRIVWHTVRSLSKRIVGPMIRLIPAPGGQIYTAEETDAVIDGNQFLMVAATQRMAQIETQADLRMCGEAVFLEKLQGFAGIDRSHAPDQYPDLQPWIFIGKRQQKFAERFRALMWPQPDIGIEIPADDPDRMSCLSQNLIKRCEIGSAVNQKSRLVRFASSPDVSSVAIMPPGMTGRAVRRRRATVVI